MKEEDSLSNNAELLLTKRNTFSSVMFPAVCHQFVNAMGKDTLIPSSSLEESTRISPFNVVAKRRKRRWIFFHKIEYSTYDFPLYDLLNSNAVFESELEETAFCSYNPESTYSLSGKFGVDIMKDLMDANLSASDKVTISAKLGEVNLVQVADPDNFMSELMTRKLNMNHPLVKQIRKSKDTVLCVIRGVIQTTDNAEIKRIQDKHLKETMSEKVTKEGGNESGEISENKKKDITLEKGTTLAYKVWELKINAENGSIEPIMTAELEGGFHHSTMDDITTDGDESSTSPTEQEETSVLQHLEEQLQPLFDLPEAEGQLLKLALLKLMTCHSDVVLLSKLLVQAETGNLKEEKEKHNELIVNKAETWTVATSAGIKTEEENVVYEGETTPILAAVAHLVDAMHDVETQDLEKLCQCNDEQLKALTKIFKSAVSSSVPIPIDTETSPALEEPADGILSDMKLTVYKDNGTILPPETKTHIHECIYCILHCVS
ncbi:uncharacterized protein LOC143059142 isoform X2 [Mytilus galloprovincialis]|uniref:uncharacterized protein LOC143059142 isoform X2 n=1 Tax=Mytilus galloprovincialis TaxID=29158 RepID=UPI003F7C0C9D